MIDAHTHLENEQFSKDVQRIIDHLDTDGLDFVVNVGSDLPTSYRSVELAEKNDRVYAVVGIHPHEAKTYDEKTTQALKALLEKEKVLALGEIGLDYHYDFSPRSQQRDVFRKQLDLAGVLDVPVVVHSREAAEESLSILRDFHQEYPGVPVLIHCFMDSPEVMREYVDMGFFLSLGGAVTFKNAQNPKLVAEEIPLDRLLLETDAPYMTPVPYRGKRNEPKYVACVAEYIAHLRGMKVEDLVAQTDGNTRRFYRLTHD